MKITERSTMIAAVFIAVIAIILVANYLGPATITGAFLVKAGVGSEKYVDVDGDGVNDLKILVSKQLSSTAVELTVTKLRGAKEAVQAAPAAVPPVEEVSEEVVPTAEVTAPVLPEEKPFPIQRIALLTVALIVMIIGVAYFYLRKGR